MPTNLFFSYSQEDRVVVYNLRDLAIKPKNKIEFHDRSELEPVKDRAGNPLPYPPNDHRSDKVRELIKDLFDKASKMAIIVGETTHESQWVDWEIRTFYDKKKNLGNVKNRIIAMKRKGFDDSLIPKAIQDLHLEVIKWNLNEFHRWLNTNPTDKNRLGIK